MHSRITCQVKGFDYDLFETIRNYKQETAEETQAEVQRIIREYSSHPNLQTMLLSAGVAELNEAGIDVLAGFFELTRKKMKSVVKDRTPLTINKTLLISVKPTWGNTEPKLA